MIAPIPPQFRFQDRSRYPSDNIEDFEWWLSNHMSVYQGERIYLPITWTAYYKTCRYGADLTGLHRLQVFLDGLDRKKKYWTVCQWDDGIINDVSMLDLRKYNMGSPGDYQLPLICQPHYYTPPTRQRKDIFCSFVGRADTHPIRKKIVDQLKGREGYYISTKHHQMPHFCEILSKSKYIIAARGYGKTSFRICEGLQYGAHIIYPSDTHLNPHNNYYDVIHNIDEKNIFEYIKSLPDPDPKKATDIYQSHFTYSANKDLILKDLKQQS